MDVMARRFFGTDGIRGQANLTPMTAEIAMKVGMAAGVAFRRGNDRHRVVRGVKQKLCTKCGKWKKLTEYYKSTSEKDGRMCSCRKCNYNPARKPK